MTWLAALGQGIGGGLGQAGGSLIGGAAADLFGVGRGEDRKGQARRIGELTQHMMKEQIKRYGNEIQYAVADARKAGLHPLFALGGAANISPMSTLGIPGQSASGGFAAEGIAAGLGKAGKSIGEAIARSVMNRNEAEAIKAMSEAKLAKAQADRIGGSIFAGMSDAEVAKEIKPQSERLHMVTPSGKKYVGRPATPVQEIEDREGEVEAMIQGAEHTYHKRVKPWYQKKGAEINRDIKRFKRSLERFWRSLR